MPDPASSTVVILLSSLVGLLAMLLATFFGVARTLRRIERRLAESDVRREAAETTLSSGESASGGAFETFLKEDPARARLPKGEQFAAYRRWRQENGLNWTNS